MDDSLQSHSDYLQRHGFLKWVLRECVRANPFYVLSAATLSYGLLQLNTEVDPQVGKLRGIVLSLLLLHIYEFCLLLSAGAVLRRRGEEGGRDLHGLAIVATLFLGGSLIALDELIAHYSREPWVVLMLLAGTLALAAAKLAVYARQSGVHLPLRHRAAALGVLTAHALTALLGLDVLRDRWGLELTQGLAWFCGWISFTAVFVVVAFEAPAPKPARPHSLPLLDTPEAESMLPPRQRDALQTRWAGAWLIALSMGLGLAHLFSADWVFDRPFDRMRLLPAAVQLLALIVLIRWRARQEMSFFRVLCCGAPVALVHGYGATQRLDFSSGTGAVNLALQLFLSAAVFYAALAWATRKPAFLLGIAGLLAAPLALGWKRFRAAGNIALGFLLLGAGVTLSLYRQKLLAYLERQGIERR